MNKFRFIMQGNCFHFTTKLQKNNVTVSKLYIKFNLRFNVYFSMSDYVKLHIEIKRTI